MRPVGRFAEPHGAIGIRRIELVIPFVAIGLKDTTGMSQVPEDVFFLPVGRKLVGAGRRRLPTPWALIENIGPYA